MSFRNRVDAGRQLAAALGRYAGRSDVIVLALPRGGVPVAFEVARTLGAPLDVFLVRKIGVPGHPELAMGAIAEGGVRVLNQGLIRGSGHPVYVGRAGRGPRTSRTGQARQPVSRRPIAAGAQGSNRHPRG